MTKHQVVVAHVPEAAERARLKDGVHIEFSPRRVRAYFDDKLIADSQRALLVFETKRPPVYWFPTADVRMDLLAPKEHDAAGDSRTVRWRPNAGGKAVENLAWSYLEPTGDLAPLTDHIAFYWNAIDAWYEEDEEVFVHPRDPYTRVDTVHSSRNVRVVVDGETVAETNRPVLLFETGLPTRYYIPKLDVRTDLLEPTETVTHCPYKGDANYWNLRVGDKTYEDFVWVYRRPIPEIPKIENLLCFYNEKVDLYVDGELQQRQNSPFS
ncbi:MAG TPA: DUF427 domain-containing protein [Candidatus Dormibacteraeota bacterium]|jgi:uncharacterized protein (DUF427 family)|nr:DUF427 domain-containing protein [Candidatus Dormibacteraeota bacterium]